MEILISSGDNFIWIRVESPSPIINETSGFKLMCSEAIINGSSLEEPDTGVLGRERSSTHDSQQRVEL